MPELKPPYPIPTAGLQNDAVNADKIADGVITNAHIATAAAIAYAKLALSASIKNADIALDAAVAYSKLATDPRISRIKTGTYTGDGSTSQAITGVGFQPKMVMVQRRLTGEAYDNSNYMRTDQFYGDFAFNIAADTAQYDNKLISLDADGFTVDDNGADEDPNAAGAAYMYLAIG